MRGFSLRGVTAYLLVLTVALQVLAVSDSVYGKAEVAPQLTAFRIVEIKVKLIFIGLEEGDIDVAYMQWKENLLPESLNQILIGNKDTGVTYKISYEFTFPGKQFKDKLLAYLRSIERIATEENPYFLYWRRVGERWELAYMKVKAAFYDADSVERWLYENRADYGGLPDNGYAFVLMYLPELPSATFKTMREYWLQDVTKPTTSVFPHYYTIERIDPDLGYKLRYRQYMTGWGGHYRIWFYDFSAGPSWWDDFSTLPLQVALEDQKVRLGTPSGRIWLSEYIADYVVGAALNLAIPSFVYAPLYTRAYRFVIYVLDDRTSKEKEAVPMRTTINAAIIEKAFRELVPYIDVKVEVIFKETSDYPELKAILDTHRQDLKEATFHPEVSYVDVRPVYKYLQDNLKDFVPEVRLDETEFTIPAFAFAFSGQTLFSYSYKWWHGMKDPETGLLLGIALGDMALVSLNHWYFTRGDEVGQKGKGIGFTSTIIHELGHMIGLMHPHQYDWVGDFVFSAMGYYSWDYEFGQFDKDAIQRIHVDQLVMKAQTAIEEARITLQSKVKSPEAESLLSQSASAIQQAEAEYAKMNYAEAVKKAKEAIAPANEALERARQLPLATVPLEEEIRSLTGQVSALTGQVSALTEQLNSERGRTQLLTYGAIPAAIVIGLVVGIVIGRLLLRRKIAT